MVHHKKKRFSSFLWHRRFGLAAIILVIILAITGIMLNHTESMNLDETYVDSALILNWYGLEPTGEPVSFNIGKHKVSQWEHQLFFDNKIITSNEQMLRGAVQSERFIVVAFDSELLLLTENGDFIDRMPTSASFSNIQRLGIKYSRPVIETSEPVYYYMADEHILDWDLIINENIKWSQPVGLNSTEKEKLEQAYRGKGLTLERVVLDLHSGRILGQSGIYLMDAAAIALLWLSMSGLWIWWQRREKEKQKKHYQKHHR